MEEKLISFETARLAKEKGFDIHCRFYYNEEMLNVYENEDFPYNSWNGSLFAPTQSLLQKWLREKYKFHIEIEDFDDIKSGELVYFTTLRTKHAEYYHKDNKQFSSYEDALEFSLTTLLKQIKLIN